MHASSAPASNGIQKAALYVNRGLGTLGFPVRIGVPPEITLLTLRSPREQLTEAEQVKQTYAST